MQLTIQLKNQSWADSLACAGGIDGSLPWLKEQPWKLIRFRAPSCSSQRWRWKIPLFTLLVVGRRVGFDVDDVGVVSEGYNHFCILALQESGWQTQPPGHAGAAWLSVVREDTLPIRSLAYESNFYVQVMISRRSLWKRHFWRLAIKKWSQVENPFSFVSEVCRVEHDICLNRFCLYNRLTILHMD